MSGRAKIPAALSIVAALLGCSRSPTQLVVLVASDLEVPRELSEIRIRVSFKDAGLVAEQRLKLAAPDGELEPGEFRLPLSFGVGPKSYRASEVTIEVGAIGAGLEQPLFVRRAITRFVERKSLLLPIFLASACRAAVCAEGETCTQDGCASELIDPHSLLEATPGAELDHASSTNDGGLQDTDAFTGGLGDAGSDFDSTVPPRDAQASDATRLTPDGFFPSDAMESSDDGTTNGDGGGLDAGQDSDALVHWTGGTQQLGPSFGGIYGAGIATNPGGYLYVAGSVGESLDGQAFAGGGADVFVTRIESDGSRAWTRMLGTSDSDLASGLGGLAVDQTRNIFISGSTYGHLDGQINSGGADAFVIKYNETGNREWTRLLGNTGSINEDFGEGVAVDGSSGEIYLTGSTSGSLAGQPHAGQRDIFLAKYAPDGTRRWVRELGSPFGDYGQAVATRPSSGDIYVAGYTNGVLDNQPALGGSDAFVAKYDTIGAVVWTRVFGSSSNDVAWGVAADTNGFVYIIGKTSGSIDSLPNSGGDDIFIAKYDDGGNRVWLRQLGTMQSDTGRSIAVSPAGDIYIAGDTLGALDGVNVGLSDVFVAKYDPAGMLQWTRQLGSTGDDRARAVALDGLTGVFVTGNAQGLDNVTPGSYAFIVKYDPNGARQ